MTKTIPDYLKLYTERPTSVATTIDASDEGDPVERFCRAFHRAVGRRLEVRLDDDLPPGEAAAWTYPLPTSIGRRRSVVLFDDVAEGSEAAATQAVPLEAACQLAAAACDLLCDLIRTQETLWRREAELAAGVPLLPQSDPTRHLAERLEAVLRASAEAIGCKAAAIYLLDAATTELKVRAVWGMPFERYLDPARPLSSARADLEALAGHAVALEDVTNYGSWQLPESCGAAVCVPVSTPTTPLGTMWIFADAPRPFSDHEVNLVEIAAGRIASDLEREMLLTETHDTARLRCSWDDASYRLQARVPQVAPLCESWEIAARTLGDGASVGEFYDWSATRDGALCAMLGSVERMDFAGALDVESIRSAWRSHIRHERRQADVLQMVHDDLWSGSTEATPAHLFTLRAAIDGTLTVASAGRITATVLGAAEAAPVETCAPPLGSDPIVIYNSTSPEMSAGDVLIVSDHPRLVEHAVAAWNVSLGWHSLPMPQLLDRLVEAVEGDDDAVPQGTILVLRRSH